MPRRRLHRYLFSYFSMTVAPSNSSSNSECTHPVARISVLAFYYPASCVERIKAQDNVVKQFRIKKPIHDLYLPSGVLSTTDNCVVLLTLVDNCCRSASISNCSIASARQA